MRFGIHAGPQDCSIDDARRLWRLADDHRLQWCSVRDRRYGLELLVRGAMPAFR
jgi:hypothetical protein